MTWKQLTSKAIEYLNLHPHKEDEQEIVAQINSGITFRGGNLWVLIFAILIASLGLNVNSTAVIIGAMLISPLMGPIIGMGFAVGTNDIDMLKRAAKNFAVATLISVLTATVYWMLTPLDDAQSELLARTSPTLYDVLIAFCGGAAGIIAISTKSNSNVIPGVAIATALMPPLCTAGYGLGTGHLLYFLGAFYLFFINTVFICLATLGGVKLMHFEQKVFLTQEREKRVHRMVRGIVIVTMIPATFMTAKIVQNSIFDSNVSKFVKSELAQSGTQIISTDRNDSTLRIVAVGREFSPATLHNAESHMGDYGLGKYRLSVIQNVLSDSLLVMNSRLLQVSATRDEETRMLTELSEQNKLYEKELDRIARLDELSVQVTKELPTLFPTLASIRLSPTDGNDQESRCVTAYVEPARRKNLSNDECRRLRQWLATRIDADSVVIFTIQKK